MYVHKKSPRNYQGLCVTYIYWLNEFVLKDSKEKAYIVRKSINNYDESLPTIYY